ncbi:MAG: division/cell wall cluster transcriptional repressor MraZ [Candidatus Nanopelagicales bacterium]
MFLGTHYPRLDDKGRLVLPAKFRDALAGGLVLAKGQDRSITVFPTAEFAAYAGYLDGLSRTNAKAQAFQRVLFSAASDEIPDRQGRITVPTALREYAGLERDVVVVGKNKTAEIWDVQAWQQYLVAQEAAYSGLDEEVFPGA